MSEWQSIDTAPKDGTNILLHGEFSDDGCKQFVGYWEPSEGTGPFGKFVWREQGGSSIAAENIVSHWMPLPEPPTP